MNVKIKENIHHHKNGVQNMQNLTISKKLQKKYPFIMRD